METPSNSSQNEENEKIPGIHIEETEYPSPTRKKARSETARRINIKNTKSPLPTARKNTPQTTRINSSVNFMTPQAQKRSPKSVGFKTTDFRTMKDLQHSRNIQQQLLVNKKAIPVLLNLENMVKNIPVNEYETADGPKKMEILSKLVNAYNLAWNEVTLQIKELSEEHAVVLFQLKSFYNSLFYDYPKLLKTFDDEVRALKMSISERDQCILSLKKQIEEIEFSFNSTRGFIYGIQRELDEAIENRNYFEKELNNQVLENDKLQSQITDLKYIILKQKKAMDNQSQDSEGNINYSNLNLNLAHPLETEGFQQNQNGSLPPNQYSNQIPQFQERKVLQIQKTLIIQRFVEENRQVIRQTGEIVELKDASVDTHDIPQTKEEVKRNFLVDWKSTDELLIKSDVFNIKTVDAEFRTSPHTSIRKIIHELMQSPSEYCQVRLIPDHEAELKKYHWVFSKIISIFLNGMRYEKPEKPFSSFDDVVSGYFGHMYQTSFLAQQMLQSLVNSVQVFEKSDPAVHLFHRFMSHDFDFNQFKFLSCILEYTINSTSPKVMSLIGQDALIPEDTNVIISLESACSIYDSLFPNEEKPQWLNPIKLSKTVEYWFFMENCINRFDECRKHIWSIIKNGFLLSDCTDINHITFRHYRNFFGLTLPTVTHEEIKQSWNELIVRNKATDKVGDMLDFDAISYYLTHKEKFFLEILKMKTSKTFHSRFYELNGSIINAIQFIVKRVVFYIPVIAENIQGRQKMFKNTGRSIREALFMCNIVQAFSHYRMFLHLVDGIHVRDISSLKLSNSSTEQDVKKFLHHFETREKAVGIYAIDPKKANDNTISFSL